MSQPEYSIQPLHRTNSVDEVIDIERNMLGLGRLDLERKGGGSADPDEPMALCLSGGGVRSATFCLGVLQGLAVCTRSKANPDSAADAAHAAASKAKYGTLKSEAVNEVVRDVGVDGRIEEQGVSPNPSGTDNTTATSTSVDAVTPKHDCTPLLGRFHYLSTVSGGSYIGSWLSAWIAREPDGVSAVVTSLAGQAAPVSARAANAEPEPVRRLRSYSNFLSPVWGASGDSLALVATFIRNLLLHWIVVIPVIVAALLLPRFVFAVLRELGIGSQSIDIAVPWTLIGAVLLCFGIAGWFSAAENDGYYEIASDADMEKSDLREAGGILKCYVVPLLIAAFTIVLLITLKLSCPAPAAIGFGIAFALGSILGARAGDKQRLSRSRVQTWLDVFAGAATAFAVWLVFEVFLLPNGDHLNFGLLTTVGVPAVLLALTLVSALRAGASRPWTSEAVREWWARSSGLLLAVAAGWAVLSFAIIQLPLLVYSPALFVSPGRSSAAGIGSVLVVIVTTLIGYWNSHGAELKAKANELGSAIGMRVLDLAAIVSLIILLMLSNLLITVALAQLHVKQEFYPNKDEDKVSEQVEALSLICHSLSTDNDCKKKGIAAHGQTDALERSSTDPARQTPEEVVSAAKEKFISLLRSPAVGLEVGARNAESPKHIFATKPQQCDFIANRSHDGAEFDCVGAGVAQKLQHPDPGAETQSPEIVLKEILNLNGSASNTPVVFLLQAQHALVLAHAEWWVVLIGIVLLALWSWGSSFFISTNAFSLSSMYGNRLTRAYLGASNRQRRPHPFTGFDFNDSLPLVRTRLSRTRPRLLHVVNAALNEVAPSGDRLEWQERKAASFVMTPYFCGSDDLGYVDSGRYGSPRGGMSLGRAMTISGAAVAPSMGVNSSYFVSMLLAFFNARLGWWLPNPRQKGQAAGVPGAPTNTILQTILDKDETKRLLQDEPCFGLSTTMDEMLSKTSSRTSFVNLSDGGHFENLGLYEMVRRRCKRILVVDAAEDGKYSYGDLENAMRKIRIDFGACIEFHDKLPTPELARESKRSWAVGHIVYSNGERGTLILIKPVLTGEESLDILRLCQRHPTRREQVPATVDCRFVL